MESDIAQFEQYAVTAIRSPSATPSLLPYMESPSITTNLSDLVVLDFNIPEPLTLMGGKGMRPELKGRGKEVIVTIKEIPK